MVALWPTFPENKPHVQLKGKVATHEEDDGATGLSCVTGCTQISNNPAELRARLWHKRCFPLVGGTVVQLSTESSEMMIVLDGRVAAHAVDYMQSQVRRGVHGFGIRFVAWITPVVPSTSDLLNSERCRGMVSFVPMYW